jgi:hypothetical protein
MVIKSRIITIFIWSSLHADSNNLETGGLLRIAIRLMELFSPIEFDESQ